MTLMLSLNSMLKKLISYLLFLSFIFTNVGKDCLFASIFKKYSLRPPTGSPFTVIEDGSGKDDKAKSIVEAEVANLNSGETTAVEFRRFTESDKENLSEWKSLKELLRLGFTKKQIQKEADRIEDWLRYCFEPEMQAECFKFTLPKVKSIEGIIRIYDQPQKEYLHIRVLLAPWNRYSVKETRRDFAGLMTTAVEFSRLVSFKRGHNGKIRIITERELFDIYFKALGFYIVKKTSETDYDCELAEPNYNKLFEVNAIITDDFEKELDISRSNLEKKEIKKKKRTKQVFDDQGLAGISEISLITATLIFTVVSILKQGPAMTIFLLSSFFLLKKFTKFNLNHLIRYKSYLWEPFEQAV